jgi:hypothetical protein
VYLLPDRQDTSRQLALALADSRVSAGQLSSEPTFRDRMQLLRQQVLSVRWVFLALTCSLCPVAEP